MTRWFTALLTLQSACAPRATPSESAEPTATARAPAPTRETEPAVAASDTDDDPLGPELNTDVPAEYRCSVRVESILSDERYRGSPNTPSHQDWVDGLSPEEYEMYIGESHAESYRECTYAVRVNGATWRYVETFDTMFAELPASWCEDARAHVEAEIQRTTHGCTALHRGAYYGSDLVALP